VIRGPQTLVVSSLVLDKGAQLVLDTTNGGVEVHVTGYMNLGKDTLVDNLSREPALARFMISAHETIDHTGDGIPDAPVTVSSKGQMFATLYAPLAEIALGNSLELFGAVTAASLGLSEGAKLHFDESLIQDDGTGAQAVQLLSWRPLELPAGRPPGPGARLAGRAGPAVSGRRHELRAVDPLS
jgi:hypothetical protein